VVPESHKKNCTEVQIELPYQASSAAAALKNTGVHHREQNGFQKAQVVFLLCTRKSRRITLATGSRNA